MKKLVLALALALIGNGAAHAAGPGKNGIMAPRPGEMQRIYKNMLKDRHGTPVKISKAPNSQYYKITNNVGNYMKIDLGRQGSTVRTAYIPGPGAKGFKPFSAYIVTKGGIAGNIATVERTSVPQIEF